MVLTDQKDLFAQAYVRAVAAVAGFIPGGPELDRESCDVQLSSAGGASGAPPRLEIQIKGTNHQPVNGMLSFPLKQKNYDDLILRNLLVPRILVVVVVPGDRPEDWLEQTDAQLSLRRCGYWLSLRGQPPTGNASTTTVQLATTQRFDVTALQQMMTAIGSFRFP